MKKVQLLSKESLGTRGEPKDEDRRKVVIKIINLC